MGISCSFSANHFA